MSELLDFYIKRVQEQEKNYINSSSEQYKQDYWDRYVCGNWWHSEDDDFPINLVEFRKKVSLEDNDEQARKYLEIHGNLAKNSEQVGSVIDGDIVKKNKSLTIEGIDFSFEELAKRMGDLFYEPLASILNSISIELEKQIDSNEKVIILLKESSDHILKAWDHCKPYITDINELEKNSKHTFDIKDTILTNEQIARAIAYLENHKLKEFLELLSSKIYKDGEADKGRGRIKLATELFACADKLKQVSEII